ncbi:MAG: hypothetical protein ACI89L_002843 [Phycisphaerales bacterium]|jgi:hypothetical protein
MTEAEQPTQTGVQRAPLNKVWVVKIVVITVLLLGFGAYGMYDAMSAYPKRGATYASYCQWQYLMKLKEAESEQPGIFASEGSVPDPDEAYTRLTDPETLSRIRINAGDHASTITLRSQARLQRFEWLKALRTIGAMEPTNTTIASPNEALGELDRFWARQESQPKALASYDIPSQWLIMGVCWFIGSWLILLMLKTMLRRYTWDPSEFRLTTPAGSFAAGDLVEVDKRKWDKFIVFLRLAEGHAMGSKEIKFDTYRHAKLEGWILAMEEERFGPQEDGEEPGGEEEDGQETEPAGEPAPSEETAPSDAAAESSEAPSEAPEIDDEPKDG